MRFIADRLNRILQSETGKTRGQAFEEVFGGAAVTRYYALTARRVLKTRRRRAGIPGRAEYLRTTPGLRQLPN